MLKKIILGFCTSIIFCLPAQAIDTNNVYAVKGAGLTACARFLESAENKDGSYLVYGGWIEGYISALNQQLDQTFDLAPWQSTPLLLRLVEANCKANENVQFHQVAKAMVGQLVEGKIQVGSSFIMINNDPHFVFQEEVIKRIKIVLRQKGFYQGAIDKTWTQDSMDALKGFQNSKGLPTSGLPDQDTLTQLFYSNAK